MQGNKLIPGKISMNTLKLIICTALVALSNTGPNAYATCQSGCAVICLYITGVTLATTMCYIGC